MTGETHEVEEALRATLVAGWRVDRGSYHSVRVDLTASEKPAQDENGEHDVTIEET